MARNQSRNSERRGPGQLDGFDQVVIEIARVTRVMKGGKRMRFRACVVLGDRKGKVGMAVAKARDVTLAVNKAVAKARKNLIHVLIVNDTIPHPVRAKFKAAKIILKPAPKGSGVIAGGAVRATLDLAGVANVVAKILGSNNKINNVKATLVALKSLKRVETKGVKKVESPAVTGPAAAVKKI